LALLKVPSEYRIGPRHRLLEEYGTAAGDTMPFETRRKLDQMTNKEVSRKGYS